jgi:KDO2-lipid IV(A) lauroyltransferase
MSGDRKTRKSLKWWLRSAIGWAGYAAIRAVAVLPFRWQLKLASPIGALGYRLFSERREVARRNLAACFPELSPTEREALLRRHFTALGASFFEMATGWFGPPEAVRSRVRIVGAEHLAAALERGKGVILFSAHFTTFEFFWSALKPLCPRLCGMYKEQKNAAANRMLTAGRLRNYDCLFEKTAVREMLRNLAGNAVVWYASDQSYGGKGSELLPFFGVPAMTNTALARIARMSGAAVLPYFCRRLPDDSYEMIIRAPLADWPSGDDTRDTLAHIALLEEFISSCPEQYWWIHQRFKGRPAPLPDLYAGARTAS